MNKFTESAKKATSVSPVMDGRTKISNDDLMSQFPNGFTIIEFDIIGGTDGKYPVLGIQELPDRYFFGGAVLMDIVTGWVDQYAGDVDGASADLTAAGGVKIKLRKVRTKRGNNLTAVDVLG